MKDFSEIRKFIENRSHKSLILCTLVQKSGSSYRAVGAKKVVSLDGESLGFLSGGCLEASIERVAREGWHRLPFRESFSTLAEEDRLLGYQTGCQGVIDILFEKVDAQNLDLQLPYGEQPKFYGVHLDLRPKTLGQRSALPHFPKGKTTNENDFLFEPWRKPVQLYVIGCGADADVYAPLTAALGWSVHFIDYRASLMNEGRFAPHSSIVLPISEIGRHIPRGKNVAVVLMTHNYEADLEVVRTFRNHQLGYLGCLGPASRWARLKEDLLKLHEEKIHPSLDQVAFAPAGIFTQGQSPEEIALSVIAQIQQELVEKPKARVWTMILAAGASRRFGSAKALAKWEDKTLLERALATASAVSGKNILVVTGAHEFDAPAGLESSFAHNPTWSKGMGNSIAFGVRTITKKDPKAQQIVILPVDQPFITAHHLQKLIDTTMQSKACSLTQGQGIVSPPAAIPYHFFAQALSLEGDRGLKSILQTGQYLTVANDSVVLDIDRPEDLTMLQPADVSDPV